MHVEIFSFNAAVAGTDYGTTWSGHVPEGTTLEDLFRMFNRVVDGDHERMAAMGYMLPSLSVGDYVTVHLRDNDGPKVVTYRVANVGFDQVTGDHDLLFRAIGG